MSLTFSPLVTFFGLLLLLLGCVQHFRNYATIPHSLFAEICEVAAMSWGLSFLFVLAFDTLQWVVR